jgi:AcrR family transcriptional regulator
MFGTSFVQRTVLYTVLVESSILPSPPPRPRRREPPSRRTALTAEAVVAAAIEVLDEAGVAGLTMRRVAQQLGTGAASLYAHVAGRDELLELVFDELIGQVALPEADPARWRDQLRGMLREFHEVLVSHRDAALAGMGRVPTSPRALAATEALVAVMEAGGLSERVIILGIDQIMLWLCASAFEEGMLERSGMRAEDVDRYYADLDTFFARLPADRFPALARFTPGMSGYGDRERFEFGLDLLIAGLEGLG